MNPAQFLACLLAVLLPAMAFAEEALHKFLLEIRQTPLGMSWAEFVKKFPEAKREGVIYLRSYPCEAFSEIIYQFREDKLIAVLAGSPWGEPAQSAEWITRWADEIATATQKTWGKPDSSSVTLGVDGLEKARFRWAGETSDVTLEFTTVASVRAMAQPITNRNVRLILGLVPKEKSHTAIAVGGKFTASRPVALPVFQPLPSIPAEYCGTFYLHKQIVEGRIQDVAPSQAFGKIDAMQVMLETGEKFKVKSVRQALMRSRLDGKEQQNLLVTFEDRDFTWGMRIEGSKVVIVQTVPKLDPREMRSTTYVVSRDK